VNFAHRDATMETFADLTKLAPGLLRLSQKTKLAISA
jgi:hypothetical protein